MVKPIRQKTLKRVAEKLKVSPKRIKQVMDATKNKKRKFV